MMKAGTRSMILGLVLALTTNGLAQQPPLSKPAQKQVQSEAEAKAAKEKEEAKEKAAAEKKLAEARQKWLEERGFDLLHEVGDQALKLEDRRSGARLQTDVAELIWPREQERELAGKLFRHAFELALALYLDSQTENLDPVTRLTQTPPSELCQEIIRRTTVCDAKLGKEFAEKYKSEKQRLRDEKRQKLGDLLEDESYIFRTKLDPRYKSGSLNTDLINALSWPRFDLLKKDVQAAVAAAQQIFSRGLPTEYTLLFLWEVAQRDREAADQLFLWLLAGIRENETAGPGQLLLIALYPFGERVAMFTDGRVPFNGGVLYESFFYGTSMSARRDPVSEELLARWFIGISFIVISRTVYGDLSEFPDAVSRLGAAYCLARWLEPRIKQFQPELLPVWQALEMDTLPQLTAEQQSWITRVLNGELPDRNQQYSKEYDAVLTGGTYINQMLDRAEKTTNFAQRDYFYELAALEADRSNQGHARAIADKIADLNLRRQVHEWISFNTAKRALAEKHYDDARRYALEVSAPDQQAYLFCLLAQAALKEKDRVGAVGLLTEASLLAGKADSSPEKVRALVSIANVYASFDPQLESEAMADAVRAANRVSNYNPEQARMKRAMGNAAGMRYDFVADTGNTELPAALKLLARTDFDGALILAESLDQPLIKLSSIVAVATVAFEKKEPKMEKVEAVKKSKEQ